MLVKEDFHTQMISGNVKSLMDLMTMFYLLNFFSSNNCKFNIIGLVNEWLGLFLRKFIDLVFF